MNTEQAAAMDHLSEFFSVRTVITSCCLSPSTSANLRLISEYRSCSSFSSCCIALFISLRDSSSFEDWSAAPLAARKNVTAAKYVSHFCSYITGVKANKTDCGNLIPDDNLVLCPLLCPLALGAASPPPVLTVSCLMRFELVC